MMNDGTRVVQVPSKVKRENGRNNAIATNKAMDIAPRRP
ncbi:unnamed protein product [Ascophyllum nodosum]